MIPVRRIAAAGLASASRCLGVSAAVRYLHRSRLLVLCYHGVVPDGCRRDRFPSSNLISTSGFEQQMRAVLRSFTPLAPSDIVRWRRGEIQTKNAFVVTFDDGYRGVLTCAAPVLQRLGIPAIAFVCTGITGGRPMIWPDELFLRVMHWPGRTIPHPLLGETRVPGSAEGRKKLACSLRESCKRLATEECESYVARLRVHDLPACDQDDNMFCLLSWDEIRKLHQMGIEIGSHSAEHPMLHQLSPGRLEFELEQSKAAVERELQARCRYFAYPNGDAPSHVVQAVAQAGYELAFTVSGRLNSRSQDPLLLGRINVPHELPWPQFEFRLSGLHDRIREQLWHARQLSRVRAT